MEKKKTAVGQAFRDANRFGQLDWDMPCELFLLTFVTNDRLFAPQRELREKMLELIANHRPTIDASWLRYLDYYSEPEPEAAEIEKLDRAIEEIVTSELWHTQIKYGQKHLPENKWKPDNDPRHG